MQLCKKNETFKELVVKAIVEEKIRKFCDTEWDIIKKQNYRSPTPEATDFYDIFALGYNIGDCVGISRQLSYSFDDVDLVSGILPLLKGSKNAEKEGGHCWIETEEHILDTTLLLVINKDLKNALGYHEEQRITSEMLKNSNRYQCVKKFTNDKFIKENKTQKIHM